MADLSQMSNEELMAIAGVGAPQAFTPTMPTYDDIGVKDLYLGENGLTDQVPQQADLSSLSDEELMSAAGIQPEAPPSQVAQLQQAFDRRKAGLFDRISQDGKDRFAQIQDIANQAGNGDIGDYEGAGRIGLKTALMPYDVASEVATSAFRSLPDAIENPIRKGASNVYSAMAGLPAMGGGTLGQVLPQELQTFQKEHPVASGRIGSVLDAGNIVAGFLPIAGTNAVRSAGMAGEKALTTTGKAASAVKDIASFPVNRALENVVTNNLDEYGLELAKKARDIGIKVPLDSISKDGALKTVGQLSQSTPFSGVKSIDKQNLSKWSNQVARTIGSDKPINARVLGEARERFGKQFDKIEVGRDVEINQDFLAGLDDLRMVANEASTLDVGNAINRQLDKLEKNIKIDPELPLTPQNMKANVPVETLATLRKNVNSLSGKSSNYEISSALGDIEGYLSDRIVDSLDDVGRKEYGDLKKQYRNFIAIKKAVKLDPEGALSSPTKLLNSVATVYKDFPTGGGGELGDLARIGKMFVSPRAQESPTFEKFATAGALASIPAVLASPVIPAMAGAGIFAGRAGKNIIYNQKAIDNAIRNGLTKDQLQDSFMKKRAK